jgi:hypothetical protein
VSVHCSSKVRFRALAALVITTRGVSGGRALQPSAKLPQVSAECKVDRSTAEKTSTVIKFFLPKEMIAN